jgi:tetratricopeptide (TPR) repeat protein
VPANIWMRAIPVPAGRHQVRVRFRQNCLLPGLLISLASAALVLVAVARSGRQTPLRSDERATFDQPAALQLGRQRRPKQPSRPLARRSGASSPYRLLLRALAAGATLALGWLVARTEMQQLQRFEILRSEADAMVHCQIADALALQHQTAQALAHFTEAVRLAERACELTGYGAPLPLGTLATAYAGAGRFDEAMAAASRARERALALGQDDLAKSFLKLMKYYNAQKRARAGEVN